jgi:hypothetical protein
VGAFPNVGENKCFNDFSNFDIFCRKFGNLGIFFPSVYPTNFANFWEKLPIFLHHKIEVQKPDNCPPQMEGLNFINPTLQYYFWIMFKRHIPLVALFATNYIIFRNVEILKPPKEKISLKEIVFGEVN